MEKTVTSDMRYSFGLAEQGRKPKLLFDADNPESLAAGWNLGTSYLSTIYVIRPT